MVSAAACFLVSNYYSQVTAPVESLKIAEGKMDLLRLDAAFEKAAEKLRVTLIESELKLALAKKSKISLLYVHPFEMSDEEAIKDLNRVTHPTSRSVHKLYRQVELNEAQRIKVIQLLLKTTASHVDIVKEPSVTLPTHFIYIQTGSVLQPIPVCLVTNSICYQTHRDSVWFMPICDDLKQFILTVTPIGELAIDAILQKNSDLGKKLKEATKIPAAK